MYYSVYGARPPFSFPILPMQTWDPIERWQWPQSRTGAIEQREWGGERDGWEDLKSTRNKNAGHFPGRYGHVPLNLPSSSLLGDVVLNVLLPISSYKDKID